MNVVFVDVDAVDVTMILAQLSPACVSAELGRSKNSSGGCWQTSRTFTTYKLVYACCIQAASHRIAEMLQLYRIIGYLKRQNT